MMWEVAMMRLKGGCVCRDSHSLPLADAKAPDIHLHSLTSHVVHLIYTGESKWYISNSPP
jgi:hypothetical protein